MKIQTYFCALVVIALLFMDKLRFYGGGGEIGDDKIHYTIRIYIYIYI